MKFDDFVTRIQQIGQFESKRAAEAAARATLEMLGRRIGSMGKEYLRYPLPAKIASFFEDEKSERFGVDKFIKFVAEHEGVSLKEAEAHASTVIAVLQEDADKKNIERIPSSLTDDYAELFQKSKTQGTGRVRQ